VTLLRCGRLRAQCTRGEHAGEAKSRPFMYAAVPTPPGDAVTLALYSAPMRDDFLANHLLAVLGPEERERLLRSAKSEGFAAHQVLYAPGREITHVYFPVGGMVSVVVKMTDAAAVEVVTIGNEGVVGIPVILGVTSTPTMEALWQIPGRALRIPAGVLREELRRTASLSRLLLRYAEAVMVQVAQHVACNRSHSMEQRCARWLLRTHDRVEGDEFPLTQQFLAQMLGVRRATVTIVAGALHKAGLIDYSRGRIRIVDRRGLEGAACECYDVVRRVMKRVTA
jgi:CRP-like cAMP-binding protein